MFIEISTNKTTIVAIRGTDVGRLHDFMEDFKLYGEPVIFMLLSILFPTVRLWSQATMSMVIQGLYEFNSFFGLQGKNRTLDLFCVRALRKCCTKPCL